MCMKEPDRQLWFRCEVIRMPVCSIFPVYLEARRWFITMHLFYKRGIDWGVLFSGSQESARMLAGQHYSFTLLTSLVTSESFVRGFSRRKHPIYVSIDFISRPARARGYALVTHIISIGRQNQPVSIGAAARLKCNEQTRRAALI